MCLDPSGTSSAVVFLGNFQVSFFFLYVCVVRLFVLCAKSEAYLTLKLNVDVSGGGDGVRVRSRVWILEIDAFHVVNTVFRYCISL